MNRLVVKKRDPYLPLSLVRVGDAFYGVAVDMFDISTKQAFIVRVDESGVHPIKAFNVENLVSSLPVIYSSPYLVRYRIDPLLLDVVEQIDIDKCTVIHGFLIKSNVVYYKGEKVGELNGRILPSDEGIYIVNYVMENINGMCCRLARLDIRSLDGNIKWSIPITSITYNNRLAGDVDCFIRNKQVYVILNSHESMVIYEANESGLIKKAEVDLDLGYKYQSVLVKDRLIVYRRSNLFVIHVIDLNKYEVVHSSRFYVRELNITTYDSKNPLGFSQSHDSYVICDTDIDENTVQIYWEERR